VGLHDYGGKVKVRVLWPDGEIYIELEETEEMATAITKIYTHEGFVIASDSRKTTGNQKENCVDGVQKIFGTNKPNLAIAFSVGGISLLWNRIGELIFDFGRFTEKQIAMLPTDTSWPVYVNYLRNLIETELNVVRSSSGLNLETDSPLHTYVFIDAYYNNVPQRATITIQHHHSHSTSVSQRYAPKEGSIQRYGSTTLIDSFLKTAHSPPTNLREAVARAQAEVAYQINNSELDQDFGWSIGGPIHIATITPKTGFEWVSGFEPSPP
jgi:hypothetical protein